MKILLILLLLLAFNVSAQDPSSDSRVPSPREEARKAERLAREAERKAEERVDTVFKARIKLNPYIREAAEECG